MFQALHIWKLPKSIYTQKNKQYGHSSSQNYSSCIIKQLLKSTKPETSRHNWSDAKKGLCTETHLHSTSGTSQ